MNKERFVEKIINKFEDIKNVVAKRALPLLLAGGITLGSIFGLAGCKSNQQQDESNNINYEEVIGRQQGEIDELKELIGDLQDKINGLKGEVNTKADIKLINEINSELVSVTKTLAELTNNIATINNYYLLVKDEMDSVNSRVDNVETRLTEIEKKYAEQQNSLNNLLAKLTTLETKVNELSNTNSSTSDNTTNDLKAQIVEMQQTINRLALENAIQKTANSRYNYIYDNNNLDNMILTAPNGNICGVIKNDEGSSYYLAEDNFVCTLNTDGTNYINYGDVVNTIQHLYVLCQGGYLSMHFDDCNIVRESDRFTISRTRDGNIETIYITLSKKGMLQNIQYDGENLIIQGADRNAYYALYKECERASEKYNNLQSIINNSWTDDCLVYSPFSEEGEEYGMYFNNKEAYMYKNEGEYGKTYGVAEDSYVASITQMLNGELELYEQPFKQDIIQSFRNMILENGENMLISYNAENDSYIIEDDMEKIEYFVENNEIISIKVLDKSTNVEKECIKIISQAEFEQKASEIQAKFNELKADYDNINNLGQ